MIFNDFETACDWIDRHTDPDTAGNWVLEEIAPDVWQVSPFECPAQC